MMVFIVNNLRDNIESSNLKNIEHKSAVGCYEASTFVKNLQKLQFDKLLVDVTAIRDASNKEAWDHFKEMLEPQKVYILYDKDNYDKSLLSDLVNRGFYNFGGTTDEILYLIDHPNMFADVQKYIITPVQKVTVPQPVVDASPQDNQPVNLQDNQSPQKLIDQSVLDEFKAEYKVSYDEVSLVPSQLLSVILIEAMLVITTFLGINVLGSKIVIRILFQLPSILASFASFVLIVLLCYLTTIPVISMAKKKTNSILRFLVVPSLLSLPALLGFLKIALEISNSLKFVVFMTGLVAFYSFYMGTLVVRGIVLNLNSENMDVVKWNICEKLGMVLVSYLFVIPFIRSLLLSFEITFFEGIYSTLYFENVDLNVMGIALLVACIVISLAIIISRTLSSGRKADNI